MPKLSVNSMISEEARIADDVTIGPFCYIGPEVVIEAGSTIGANVTIVGRTHIGPETRISPMAVIGTTSTGRPDSGQVRMGPENEIREHVTIYGGLDRPTQLGARNLVMIGCQVGAGALLGNEGIFANFTQIGDNACIEDYVRTSGFTFIEPSVRVGDYTFTAGYADIDRDAPPYAMVQGCPFRVRGVNSHNLKRCGFGQADIRSLKSAFREIFNGTGLQADKSAMQRILAEPDINPNVRRLIAAVQQGKWVGQSQ
jgi:UDP-N-acetylglucosamine acyltransferase